MRRNLVKIEVVALKDSVGLPAAAHKQVRTDGNDTAGALDIRRVATEEEGIAGDRIITFTLVTWQKFTSYHISPPRGHLAFVVKTGATRSIRIEVARAPSGRIRATIVYCNAQGCDYEHTTSKRVTRPTDWSVRFKVKRSELFGVGNTLRYAAEAAYKNACDGHCYHDRIPNGTSYFSHAI